MGFLGLVPSEHSTGDRRRQGSITKSGPDHARRLLVEAAWHYRRPPRRGRELERRQAGQRGTPLVATDADGRAGPRKTRLGGPYDFMRRVLATDKGADLYSRRQSMVEPVFAHIKQNRRAGRFKRRGRAAVRSEWRLIAATHNLLKLHRQTLAGAAV